MLQENQNTDTVIKSSDDKTDWMTYFQLILVSFFTAFIMMIVHMHTYQRPMGQFDWYSGQSGEMVYLTDFFSYYKMLAILASVILALLILSFLAFRRKFVLQRSYAYIPMGIYGLFVLLSFLFSEYKIFALWGFNDRFEGTLTLLAYMVMLFFIINTITDEKGAKWIVYATGISSGLLGLLGMSQALDQDMFQTGLGKMIITPIQFWSQTGSLHFTFQNQEIYQTVYNPTYVAFYLTLLLPIFSMIFMKENERIKKWIWGILILLLVFNLVGSASICGIGILASVLMALIVLNKRLLLWKKPLLILLAISLVGCVLTLNRYPLNLPHNDIAGTNPVMSEETDEVSTAPQFGFKNHQDFADGRGYIWSRTLPMLKDTVLIGHGADTFCIYFPQDDHVGKIRSNSFPPPTTVDGKTYSIVVDKPFNMYLGIATGTGLVSLLALLTLWGLYIVQSFRLYRRADYEEGGFLQAAGAGIFFGVCGFLTAGLFADSAVSVMPLFYGLLGTGICINRFIAQKNEQQRGESHENY